MPGLTAVFFFSCQAWGFLNFLVSLTVHVRHSLPWRSTIIQCSHLGSFQIFSAQAASQTNSIRISGIRMFWELSKWFHCAPRDGNHCFINDVVLCNPMICVCICVTYIYFSTSVFSVTLSEENQSLLSFYYVLGFVLRSFTCYLILFIIILKDFIYLFLERGEGRKRNINMWLLLACALLGTQACYSNRWPFALQSSTQSTEPHQPGHVISF